MTPVAVGLDVGGTKIAGGIVADDGQVLERIVVSSVVDGQRDPGLKMTRTVANTLVGWAVDHGVAIQGIGIGLPEYIRADGTVASRLVMEWDIQPLTQFADFGTVAVDSDVRCGARAEATLGAGQGYASTLYVSVGTGISCATTLDGIPLIGQRGEAIALGELPVARSVDPACELTLEEYASGVAISQRYFDSTGVRTSGAAEVIAAADSGDHDATLVVDSAARATAHAISWAIALIDPSVVILGGGLGTSAGRWSEELQATLNSLVAARPDPPPLFLAALDKDAGMIGAALAVMA